MNEKYMKEALKEAKKSFKKNEIPIGTVIVKNNEIISKGYNSREKNKDVICHAEINAIRKANKKSNDWRLDDCIIYTTMEPCLMCMGTIFESRIKKIVCGIKNNKTHNLVANIAKKNNIEIEYGILKTEILDLNEQFFKKLREKNK